MSKEKNVKNKKKHSKLMAQKKNKKRSEKEQRVNRLKAILQKANEQKEGN